MRVISGIYKRRRFDIPRTFKARPTTDFAKENLFNVLSNYMDFEEHVSALDLFAGTGSISIELVSRGCDKVISVEKDPQHYAFISQIMKVRIFLIRTHLIANLRDSIGYGKMPMTNILGFPTIVGIFQNIRQEVVCILLQLSKEKLHRSA